MTVKIAQDISFINTVRGAGTAVLEAANTAQTIQGEWNSCFGGAGRLAVESFIENNEGLTKTDIDTAIGVLIGLNTWLDEAGPGRRAALMAIMNM